MTDQADTVRKPFAVSRSLPAPCSPPGGASPSRATVAEAGFAAQMLGADGQRRGLKGGAPALRAARRAYLQAQWGGHGDRRAVVGAFALARV